MAIDKEDIMFEHYKMIRSENLSILDELRKIEVVVIGAICAFYAWGANNGTIQQVWGLAAVMAVFGAIRTLMLFKKIGVLSGYLKLIEQAWVERDSQADKGFMAARPDDIDGQPGRVNWPSYWETYFFNGGKSRAPQAPTHIILWLLILGVTFLAPTLLLSSNPASKPPLEGKLIKEAD